MRVRVERDEFCDDEPGPPKAAEGVHISGPARRVPYTVTVSLLPSFKLSCLAVRDSSFLTLHFPLAVLHRRAGSRSNSVVEGIGGHNGRRIAPLLPYFPTKMPILGGMRTLSSNPRYMWSMPSWGRWSEGKQPGPQLYSSVTRNVYFCYQTELLYLMHCPRSY